MDVWLVSVVWRVLSVIVKPLDNEALVYQGLLHHGAEGGGVEVQLLNKFTWHIVLSKIKGCNVPYTALF
jgi:hypothetical protein